MCPTGGRVAAGKETAHNVSFLLEAAVAMVIVVRFRVKKWGRGKKRVFTVV